MKYLYKCTNDKCSENQKEVTVDKPMSESSREEHCEVCKKSLTREYKLGGITTGDGTK